jgi:hypothetical protein
VFFLTGVHYGLTKALFDTGIYSTNVFTVHMFALCTLKGIVSRDFVVCFLVSFDRSHISTHQELIYGDASMFQPEINVQ